MKRFVLFAIVITVLIAGIFAARMVMAGVISDDATSTITVDVPDFIEVYGLASITIPNTGWTWDDTNSVLKSAKGSDAFKVVTNHAFGGSIVPTYDTTAQAAGLSNLTASLYSDAGLTTPDATFAAKAATTRYLGVTVDAALTVVTATGLNAGSVMLTATTSS